jgi:hypothetical protein
VEVRILSPALIRDLQHAAGSPFFVSVLTINSLIFHSTRVFDELTTAIRTQVNFSLLVI